jgi:hypothetical protein
MASRMSHQLFVSRYALMHAAAWQHHFTRRPSLAPQQR